VGADEFDSLAVLGGSSAELGSEMTVMVLDGSALLW
jgi:hypothetical protein